MSRQHLKKCILENSIFYVVYKKMTHLLVYITNMSIFCGAPIPMFCTFVCFNSTVGSIISTLAESYVMFYLILTFGVTHLLVSITNMYIFVGLPIPLFWLYWHYLWPSIPQWAALFSLWQRHTWYVIWDYPLLWHIYWCLLPTCPFLLDLLYHFLTTL